LLSPKCNLYRYVEDHRIVLVQEYCNGGTLLAMVQKQVDRKRHERRAAAAAAKAGVVQV
jgi:hypothetical protein